MKHAQVLERNLVLIPINVKGSHWTLVTVTRRTGHIQIKYYDSYEHDDLEARKYITTIRELYKKMLNDYTLDMTIPSHWGSRKKVIVTDVDEDVPLQTNSYDCGVFVCMFAFCVILGLNPNTFTQKETQFFREHITITVLSGELYEMFRYYNVDPDKLTSQENE